MEKPNPKDSNFYIRLGLHGDPLSFTLEQIKTAYFMAVKTFPPQRDSENFQLIKEAYDTLSNTISKNEYDSEVQFGDKLIKLKERLEIIEQEEEPDKSKMVRIIKKILLLNPKSSIYRHKLGLIFIDLERYTDALNQFKSALKMVPTNAAYQIGIGDAYSGLEEYTLAVKSYKKAIKIDSDDHTAYIRISQLWFHEMGKKKAAYDLLEESIQADGEVDFLDFFAIFQKVEFYGIEGKKTSLNKELTRIVKIAKNEQEKHIASFMLLRNAFMIASYGYFDIAYKYSSTATKMTTDEDNDNLNQILKEINLALKSKIDDFIKAIIRVRAATYFGAPDPDINFDEITDAVSHRMSADPMATKIKNDLRKVQRNYPEVYNMYEKFYSAILSYPRPTNFSGECPGIGCDSNYIIPKQGSTGSVYTCNRCGTDYEWSSSRQNFISYSSTAYRGSSGSGGDYSPPPSNSSWCFVATAVYGESMHPNVVYLRAFRDQVLANYIIGQKFISFYYKNGPFWAKKVKNNKYITVLIKNCILNPLVKILRLFHQDDA